MKDGLRFVDSDMHVQEPGDLFVRYLDSVAGGHFGNTAVVR